MWQWHCARSLGRSCKELYALLHGSNETFPMRHFQWDISNEIFALRDNLQEMPCVIQEGPKVFHVCILHVWEYIACLKICFYLERGIMYKPIMCTPCILHLSPQPNFTTISLTLPGITVPFSRFWNVFWQHRWHHHV